MGALEAKLNHLIPETGVFEILARSGLELGLTLEEAPNTDMSLVAVVNLNTFVSLGTVLFSSTVVSSGPRLSLFCV